MDDMTAVGKTEFSGLMDAVVDQKPAVLAIALSGGVDSMALCLLLQDWCAEQNITLHALSVDHGLRPESAQEIEHVGSWLSVRKIKHHVLHWQGDKPASGLQQGARLARYRLMGEWCAAHGVQHLLVAHHLDDQAETFLMRLFRGSGVSGLSAMKALSPYPVSLDHIPREKLPFLCRPLLRVAKSRLRATLIGAGQDWIEDPSNENDSFMRVKVRKLLAQSTIEGLNAGRLADTADRMARVQSLLEQLTQELARKAVHINPAGYAVLEIVPLKQAHEEIALRLLAALCRMISGGSYVPRMTKLQNLFERLNEDGFSGQTLSGCRITAVENGKVYFIREEKAIGEDFYMAAEHQKLWDGRFWISSRSHQGKIKRLSLEDWTSLVAEFPQLKEDEILNSVRYTLPCLMKEDGKIILPTLFKCFENKGIKAEYLGKI